MGGEEDQQCSHCKSRPCPRVDGSSAALPVSPGDSLESGRSRVAALWGAREGPMLRHVWWGSFEPLCSEVTQRVHPGRPGCTSLIQPRTGFGTGAFLQAVSSEVRESQGTGKVAAAACLPPTFAMDASS